MASTSDLQTARQNDYVKFKRYAAWTFIVASPILIASPPRKLDLNTAALTGAFAISANYLYKDSHQGRGLIDDLGMRYFGASPVAAQSSTTRDGITNLFNTLPTEKAEKVQAQLRAAKESSIKTQEELERYQSNKRFEDRSLPEKIWMGSEAENWKEKRLREEQEALNEGKGYGDLIMDHIWEVWNWGKPNDQKKRDELNEKKDSPASGAGTTNKLCEQVPYWRVSSQNIIPNREHSR
ncbi:conserved hypothetical protein [Talaromyces stipitatus ATCC 10500]|uniref:Rhomboid family membrane protein n=1 Tax=Talaromyces stipitatus (strain ATCC 10500 / CBS 375.48 / QM 6759 / NRRL 1006) TaxID=441959 RepID=B8MQZ6_TALSN|nr:uncharacterized protein TSTA_053490 [Talaromyces stipitatus ATCC 10500]EED12831.1 conserved hypothetical protein [Talaromyces stipitatus ATCC 10500]